MNKYCVVARFDDVTNQHLFDLKKKAHALQSIHYTDQQWPPHMTLGVYEIVDVELICRWVEEFVQSNQVIPISFKSLGIYPHGQILDTDVIYICPTSSIVLTQFYYNFHQKLDEYSENIGKEYSIKDGNPVFHSTITICHKNDFNTIFDQYRDSFQEVDGKIVALEVYEIPIRLVRRYEFKI